MHIPDGFLPPRVCLTGYALTGLGAWYSLRCIRRNGNPTEQIPKASLLTAAFFVTSLISIPIPPASIHLILNGLLGIMLGYYAFLAILIGLFFQAVMFQHGGLTTLGINAVMMGFPALLAYHCFQMGRRWSRNKKKGWQNVFAFISGGGALGLSALIFTFVTLTFISADFNEKAEQTITYFALAGYGLQAIIEGVFTAIFLAFIRQVKPELLSGNGMYQSASSKEVINQS
ncbi:MAG: cobalt transporter CbiM [Microcystaceae cyanobacterium]